MKLIAFSIIFMLIACSSNQNETNTNPEKISEEAVWIAGSSVQGYSGTTALGDLSNIDIKDSFSGELGEMEYQFEHEIDSICSQCCAENSSTAGMNQCSLEAIDSWEREMKLYYDSLMLELDEDGKKNLVQSEEKWQEFLESEHKLLQSIYGNRQGTIWSTIFLGKYMDVYKSRALELKLYYLSFKDEFLKG